MIDVFIPDARGRILDARVEVGAGDIILHSRSGAGEAARNPAYREALETILARLQAEGLKPEVFLDSARSVSPHLPTDGSRSRPSWSGPSPSSSIF